jgi:hypothetical protein
MRKQTSLTTTTVFRAKSDKKNQELREHYSDLAAATGSTHSGPSFFGEFTAL